MGTKLGAATRAFLAIVNSRKSAIVLRPHADFPPQRFAADKTKATRRPSCLRWYGDSSGQLQASFLLPAFGLAIVSVTAAAQDIPPSPGSLSVEERLERVERKLDRLLELLDRSETQRPSVAATTRPSSRINSGFRAGPVAETPGPDGWHVTVSRVDTGKPDFQGDAVGTYVSENVSFTMADHHGVGGLPAVQPVGHERMALFRVETEGWYAFGLEVTFPPRGFDGYLGGFVCKAEVRLGDEFLLDQTVRMPYGLANRVKRFSGTRILIPGQYLLTERLACAADGRHSADPANALDGIAVQSLVKRPDDRRLRPARSEEFHQPGSS